jgi:hypothetical protein
LALLYNLFYRRVWSQEEDDAIRALVTKYGTKTWSVIAEQIIKEYNIEGRTGKQCRERWHNHLGELFSSYVPIALAHSRCLCLSLSQIRISTKINGPKKKKE